MFKENFNHFVGFLSDEVMFRKKKIELNNQNKKRNYFMFSLTYIFLFLLVFKILGFF